MAERLGCRSAAVAATHDDKPAMAIDGFPLDLVVLVLEGGWAGGSSTWASGAWGVSARLTSTYRAAEVPVLAVSAGAGAGAVASCVAQGAQALFSLDQLPDTLRSLSRFAGDDFAPASETPLPSQFRALVRLTASERRILFYLTEGWAAQDIAEELVVSLTTVRSHIRSTLRKLGVRSQLAAVAIANSRDLDARAVAGRLLSVPERPPGTILVGSCCWPDPATPPTSWPTTWPARVPDLQVIVEHSPSRLQMARRRARRHGWPAVIGQVLFVVVALPLLRRRGRHRIAAIVSGAGLDASPYPVGSGSTRSTGRRPSN